VIYRPQFGVGVCGSTSTVKKEHSPLRAATGVVATGTNAVVAERMAKMMPNRRGRRAMVAMCW
jgi:hypothetical protein